MSSNSINSTSMNTTSMNSTSMNSTSISYTLDYHFEPEYLKDTCNVHNFSKENEDKYLVSYNKSKTNIKENVDTVGLHRSLIFLNNRLVCFSPPKSLSFEHFRYKHHNIDTNELLIEEFVEGTMINTFYNNISKSWEIATKNNIGATNIFYKGSMYSFSDLFYNTCECLGLYLETALNKNYSYSFVMKHPYNPLVQYVTHPQLYLIEVYEIEHVSESNIQIHVRDRNKIAEQLSINWDIKIPRQFNFKSYEDMIFPKLLIYEDPYYIRKCISMGYIIKNKITNERTKLRNEEYQYLHRLRGNQYDFFYQYLLLRKSGQVKDFLNYFPENNELLNYYRDTFHNFTLSIYSFYCLVHIEKRMAFHEIPGVYKNYVYKLHGLYISKKNDDPSFKITKKYVIDYVNKLPTSLLYTSYNKHLNYINNSFA